MHRAFASLLVVVFGAFSLRAQPTTPTAASPDTSVFEGTWLGEVIAPNDRTAIGFSFQRAPRGLLASFHMPAMFLTGALLGPAQVSDGKLQIPPLTTTLTREGELLVGTFGLSHLPVAMRRVEKFPAAQPPATFPAAPASLWTTALGAETWASPVVRDGAIYLGTADGKFHALDAADGRERWSWTGPNALYGTALVTDERVYFVDQRTDLVCLARADGRLAWRTALHNEQLGGPLKPNATYTHRTVTPVLRDGTLHLGSTDGGIYALDAASGEILWRHDAKTKIHATAGIDGGALLFGGLDGTVLVFDPRTQKEIVRMKLPGPVVSTPVVASGNVVVGCRDYMLYGLKREDLSIAWKYSYWFSWVESTPAVIDGVAYVGGSDYARISALDPATSQPRWTTIVHGLAWGTPLVTADVVFAGTHAQDDAIIPHQGGILALDRKTGAVKWRRLIPTQAGVSRAGIIGSLALAGDKVIAACFDGTVIALPAK